MCTTPNNSFLQTPATTARYLDEDSNMDVSEEEGEVLESHFTREVRGADDGRMPRHHCRSREHLVRSSSRSSSASSGDYLRRRYSNGGRRRYHDHSSEDDDGFCEKRHEFDYKRKYSEGSFGSNGNERKKLRFIPPVKKRTAEVETLSIPSINKQNETVGLSRRWGPRLVHVDQNAKQEVGELGGLSHTVPTPADIATITTGSSMQSCHGSLGNRFQPPTFNAKAPIVSGGHNMDSMSASRWNTPSTDATSILSNTTTTLKLSRWSAPPNNNASSKMSTNHSLSRWIAPPTSVSKSSLTNLAPSTQHGVIDPHHLPLKKRFYVDISLKDTLGGFGRMTEQHPIVTTSTEERSTFVPHINSEGESSTPIMKDERCIPNTCSNCKNTKRYEFTQVVARQRVVSKDEPLEQCVESFSRAQEVCEQIPVPLPQCPNQCEEPFATFEIQKSMDAVGSEPTEVGSVEPQHRASCKINAMSSARSVLFPTEPRSPPSSKLISSTGSPTQSPVKRILSSVKPPAVKHIILSNNHAGPSMVHDLRVSRDESLSSSKSKKPPHIHIKITKSTYHQKSLDSPGRAHIHIKLPKITKSRTPDESLDSQGKQSEVETRSFPGVPLTPAGISGKQELPASKNDSNPKKLHVPYLASARVDIESKAQMILAKARMRLQASAGVKERPKTPTFESRTEIQHGESPKCVPSRPAVLSESPLSVRCIDVLHSEKETETSKVIRSLEPSLGKDVRKPNAVQMLHSEISIPRKSVTSSDGKLFSSIPGDDPLCYSKAQEVNESRLVKIKNKPCTRQEDGLEEEVLKLTSDADTLSVDTNPKTFKRLRKKASAPVQKLAKKPSTKEEKSVSLSDCSPAKNRKASKKKSFDLSSFYQLDNDTDSSDSDSSTDTSSSSSTDSSTSSSSSSSLSSSSTSSSSESSSVSESSSSSSSSSSFDSPTSSDFDISSEEDDNTPSYSFVKKTSQKRTLKKPKRKYHSRRRSSADVIMGPAPPKEQELTDMEIRKILQQDSSALGMDNTAWVRRSSRQPSKNLINSPSVRDLLNRLQCNDADMIVLKMKKYLNDPNLPPVVMNAALDALEENSNCQALYIQNFNNAMKDEQMMHLLRILQAPKCLIWCLNIGETYNVSHKTWTKFAKGLKHTKVTHMYASEHTITSELKDLFRNVIRNNRKKHDMHINPNNLDVIVKCTHCWWNPINAAALRPYIKDSAYEQILFDKESLGLKGTTEGKNADTI